MVKKKKKIEVTPGEVEARWSQRDRESPLHQRTNAELQDRGAVEELGAWQFEVELVRVWTNEEPSG